MPKDKLATNEIVFAKSSYTTITVADIQKMQSVELSGMETRILLLLMTHCWNGKTSCFPSLKRLAVMLGIQSSSALQSISRCLKALEDKGLIQRNGRKSKDRFVMIKEKRSPILRADSKFNKSVKEPANEFNHLDNRKEKPIETEETKPPLTPPQAEGAQQKKTTKRKNYKSKWRSPQERRATKAQRAAARAQRQRAQQTERERCCPVERKQRLQNALGDIAFHQEPRGLLSGDLEHLEAEVEPWFKTLGEIARKDWFNINEIGEEAFLEMIYAAIRRL